MSTEHTPASGTDPIEPTPVTYTPEQQAHMQTLIDKAVGRSTASVRNELNSKVNELQTKLAEAERIASQAPRSKKDDANEDVAELRAKLLEATNYREQARTEIEGFKTMAREKEQEAATARTQAQSVQKEVAMQRAIAKTPFYDAGVVVALTKDSIEWDNDRNTFVVKGDNGQTRLDNTLEKPLSLEAYFQEYASKNKFLVKADITPGTGSSEGSRTDLSRSGRFEVADVFGPKSDSRKASALMKDNPAEYHRMKGLAKEAGLIG